MAQKVKPTGEQADRALAELERADRASTAAALADAPLNAALEPFRGQRPLRLRCSRRGCGDTVAWLALSLGDARVIFSVTGPRKGFVERQNRGGPPRHLRVQPPAPYDYWSLGPSGGTDSAEPAVRPRTTTALRWTFHCQKCRTPYTLTNGTLIKKLISALAGNARDLSP